MTDNSIVTETARAHIPDADPTPSRAAGTGTRTLTVSRTAILALGGAIGGLATFSLGAGAYIVISLIGEPSDRATESPVAAAYEARIAALTAERDAYRKSEAATAARLGTALAEISKREADVMALARERTELSGRVNAARAQLTSAVDARREAEAQIEDLSHHLAVLREEAKEGVMAAELDGALSTLTSALDAAVVARDTARTDLDRLQTDIATLELTMEIASERQAQLVAGLEDAVEMSFKPLETMFDRSGLDVDDLMDSIRLSYSGFGGSALPITVSTRGFDDPALNERFAAVMDGMDKMNMMRIVATKVPYAMPVTAAHRFTSGFGTRRDPKTGARRAHNGIDLAAPRGTPILSTADGVVVFAARQSGYGNLIKIRHEFGFETVYAHLNKIHVAEGDRIARGDHIGDMGTTGRSTGVHLHYEVRIGGRPVNPMTFIRAARDVF
ncbi:MAG: DUF5930 domain-containing protein [Pseudomonadota bacterium]